MPGVMPPSLFTETLLAGKTHADGIVFRTVRPGHETKRCAGPDVPLGIS